jgi:molecular chaperone HtpG
VNVPFVFPPLFSLYSLDGEGRFLRSLEQSREIANPLWASVLGKLGQPERANVPLGWLYLNWENPLIRRLARVGDAPLLRRLIQLLYLQALLLGHHPLSSKEMKLLNEGLLELMGWSIAKSEQDI